MSFVELIFERDDYSFLWVGFKFWLFVTLLKLVAVRPGALETEFPTTDVYWKELWLVGFADYD